MDKDLRNLAKQLQKGHIEVFDEIYHITKNLIFYTIFNILKDRQSTEDIMQETYLIMLEKIHSHKPSKSFQAWLVTIARNLALAEYNKRKREFRVDLNENEFLFGTVESTSEKEYLVQEMLKKLTPDERDVVILHKLGSLKLREVSKELNKPIGTVSWIYNEAIKKLRKLYESR